MAAIGDLDVTGFGEFWFLGRGFKSGALTALGTFSKDGGLGGFDFVQGFRD